MNAFRSLPAVVGLCAALLAPAPALAVDVGAAAPAFALPDARGAPVALDKLRGQVVYVDFWASWCTPCKRSFPWMNELQQRWGGKGLAVVAINVDKKRDDADRFLRQVPATFTVVFDETGATPAAFGVKAMPSSYLIDTRGNVVEIEQGYRDERRATLEERIRALVAAR
jgi:cytochrome c biogenesis protein CcmG, thiol:disulfide interchange protein DsbE